MAYLPNCLQYGLFDRGQLVAGMIAYHHRGVYLGQVRAGKRHGFGAYRPDGSNLWATGLFRDNRLAGTAKFLAEE